MNKLLNHIAQVFRWILKIVFCQVPEGFFAHSVAQFGSDIPSIRQVTHRKPPFYSSSTKQFSCNGLCTDAIAENYVITEFGVKCVRSTDAYLWPLFLVSNQSWISHLVFDLFPTE